MKLNICGHEFTIERHKDIHNEKDEHLDGQLDTDGQVIKIREGLHAEKEREVLWHEIVHEIDEATGLGLTEQQVTSLGRAIPATIRANKWLGHTR